MNPAVSESERHMQAPELRSGPARETMLEPVESAAHSIELPGIVRIGVETKIRHERIARFRIIHHQLTITLSNNRS